MYDFYQGIYLRSFGRINGLEVANLEAYQTGSMIDGRCQLVWRSGIKHDCARVMELVKVAGDCYLNGFKEQVRLEDEWVYPLVKSSDIARIARAAGSSCVAGSSCAVPAADTVGAGDAGATGSSSGSMVGASVRKYLLVTQRSTSDNTDELLSPYPLTRAYLLKHARYLDQRRSSIYRNRPRFCLFGVGDYSFLPYKVVISALYQKPVFALLEPYAPNNRPMMVDDTCYALSFQEKEQALITIRLLNSPLVQAFIRAVASPDAKRVITKDILMRIDLLKALHHYTPAELALSSAAYERYQHFLQEQS